MNVTRALAAILRPRFPTVVLRDSYTIAPYWGRRWVDVFHVPDERYQEFLDFSFDELPALLEAAGLFGVHVDPHRVTYTRENFPEIPPRRDRNHGRPKRAARPTTPRRSRSAPRAGAAK